MPDEQQLDPKIVRELEAAGLPTIPTLALSDFPKSIWNRLMAPAEASQEVMKSGEIGAASVTPQQTLEMGTALVPAFGRAGIGLGVAGSGRRAPKEVLEYFRTLRGLIAKMEREHKQISQMHQIMPNGPQKEQTQVLVETSRSAIDNNKRNFAAALEEAKKQYGEDFEFGSPSGELGAGGGRPPIGGTRGSSFLNPTSRELERFWNRVNAYKSVGRIAWAEGVSQHTIRERLQSPFWAKPADFKPMSPQIVAQMDGLTAVTPKAPTPADVERFWGVIGRYQRLKNWRTPVKQILGLSDGQLDRRLNDPRWQRSAAKPKPDDELSSASFSPAPRTETMREETERQKREREEFERKDRRFDEHFFDKPPPEVTPGFEYDPNTMEIVGQPTAKMSQMSVDEFYGPADDEGVAKWKNREPDYEKFRDLQKYWGNVDLKGALTPRESTNVEIKRPPVDYTNPVPGPP